MGAAAGALRGSRAAEKPRKDDTSNAPPPPNVRPPPLETAKLPLEATPLAVPPGSPASAASQASRVSESISHGTEATSTVTHGSHSKAHRRNEKKHRIQPVVADTETEVKVQRSMSSTAAVEEPETREFLASVMRTHFVFGSLQDSEYYDVFKSMRRIRTRCEDVVFSQGDVGDSCYFIRTGNFSVSIDQKVLKELRPGQTFGELALLYQTLRSATITCKKAGELWQMDHNSFRRCMAKLSSAQSVRAQTFFRSDANFNKLSEEDIRELAGRCSVQQFSDGELILREGEVGEWMLFVISGKVAITGTSNRRHSHSDHAKHDHDAPTEHPHSANIGSVGLIYGKLQATGFRAHGPVTCLALGKGILHELSMDTQNVLRRCAMQALLLSLTPPRGPSNLGLVFAMLTESQQHRIAATAEDGIFDPGEVIICPGDPAQLVIVIDGEAAILKEIAGFEERNESVWSEQAEESLRSSAVRLISDGMAHGEEPELFSGVPMSHYVVALGRVRLHRITSAAVQRAFGEPLCEFARQSQIKRVLSDIFLFKNLREDQVERTVRRMEQQCFRAGEIVVKEGEPAKDFFLIQNGTITVRKGESVLRTLGRWDYFGERGLLLDEKRSATCEALEDCICLVLDAQAFFEIVGMFRRELERRMHLQDLNITMSDMDCEAIVGRGSFGVVRLVHPKKKKSTKYALKCVKKLHVVKNRQEKSIVMEREVNAQCYHPCIMQFIKTFQDSKNVYFLTEFLGGGDLFFAIREIGALTKGQAQFFSGCITLGIEYLHARGIMYRDLKPENVLLDFEGYGKLVDFGCCTKERQAFSLVGTPEYLAPEVILGKGYVHSVDWWSLGVMMYEFIVGPLPFGAEAEDQMETFKAILEAPLVFPSQVEDTTAKSVMRGLLDRQPSLRLAGADATARKIKDHPYFAGFNWDALAGGFFKAPWKPDVEKLMSRWEPPDGDLMNHFNKASGANGRGMEWAKDF